MTISEEKKTKVIELYKKGDINKSDIALLAKVSPPKVRDIIKEYDTREHPERIKEKNETVEKKLSEIFYYENPTEEEVIGLIWNLRQIARKSGQNLGDFFGSVCFIFERYYKITDSPKKVFDFLLDVSENLSLLLDLIEPQEFLKMVDDYHIRNEYLNELEKIIKENEKCIKNELIPKLDMFIEKREILAKKIIKRTTELDKLIEKKDIIDKKLQENQSIEEDLQKALHDNEELKIYVHNLNNEYKKLATEYENTHKTLQKLTKNSEQINKENSLLKIVFERLGKLFPNEVETIIGEIGNEHQ